MNAGGRVVGEERGVVQANEWFPVASCELAEDVIGLGRYGKTLTVLSVKQEKTVSG
jgi:hypothetical protein